MTICFSCSSTSFATFFFVTFGLFFIVQLNYTAAYEYQYPAPDPAMFPTNSRLLYSAFVESPTGFPTMRPMTGRIVFPPTMREPPTNETVSPTGVPTMHPTGSTIVTPPTMREPPTNEIVSPTGFPTMRPMTGRIVTPPTMREPPTNEIVSPTGFPTMRPMTGRIVFPPTMREPPTNEIVSPTGSPTMHPTRSTIGTPPTNGSSTPTGLPTLNPTAVVEKFVITSRVQSCYATCSYKNSRDSSLWTEQNYCTFYASTGCTGNAVSQYSCLPQCLSSCVDVYCSDFAIFAYGCGENIKLDTELSIDEITTSCKQKYQAQAHSKTRAIYNATIGLTNLCEDVITTENKDEVEDTSSHGINIGTYGLTLSSRTSSSLSYVVAKTLKISGNSTVKAVSTSTYTITSSTASLAAVNPSPNYETVQIICITNVTFNIDILAESLGYSSNSIDALNDYVSSTLDNSITSGQFIDDVHTEGILQEDFTLMGIDAYNTFSNTIPSVIYIATLSPTSSPTRSPSQAPTSLYEKLQITSTVLDCYDTCSYPGSSSSVSSWTKSDFCTFYESTGCTANQVNSYSCPVSCLSNCAYVYCPTFAILSLGCGNDDTSSSYGYLGSSDNISESCIDAYLSSTESKTFVTLNTTIAITGIPTSALQYNDITSVTGYASLNSIAKSVLSSVVAKTLALSKNSTVTVTYVSKSFPVTSQSISSGVIGYITVYSDYAQNVTFTIDVLIETLGYSPSSIGAYYSYVSTKLDESVTSGTFVKDVQATAQALGVSELDNIGVASSFSSPSSPVVTYVTTSSPTMAPVIMVTTPPPTTTSSIPGCPIKIFLEDSYGDGWQGAYFIATSASSLSNIDDDSTGITTTILTDIHEGINFDSGTGSGNTITGYAPKVGVSGAKLSLVIQPHKVTELSMYSPSHDLEENWEIVWGFALHGKKYYGNINTVIKLQCQYNSSSDYELHLQHNDHALADTCDQCDTMDMLGLPSLPEIETASDSLTIKLSKSFSTYNWDSFSKNKLPSLDTPHLQLRKKELKQLAYSISSVYYSITDNNRINLLAKGSLCHNTTSITCVQKLEDGQYVLRVGSLFFMNGSFEFCGIHGQLHTEIIFQWKKGSCQILERSVQPVEMIDDDGLDDDDMFDWKSVEKNEPPQESESQSHSFFFMSNISIISLLLLTSLLIIFITVLSLTKATRPNCTTTTTTITNSNNNNNNEIDYQNDMDGSRIGLLSTMEFSVQQFINIGEPRKEYLTLSEQLNQLHVVQDMGFSPKYTTMIYNNQEDTNIKHYEDDDDLISIDDGAVAGSAVSYEGISSDLMEAMRSISAEGGSQTTTMGYSKVDMYDKCEDTESAYKRAEIVNKNVVKETEWKQDVIIASKESEVSLLVPPLDLI